jgi:hypothetical protein
MAFSVLFLSRTGGENDYVIRSAQAADPEEMARVVAAHLADIVAVNAAIDDPDEKFTPVDANLAAAGDGHTFIFTVMFSRTRLAAVQTLLFGGPVVLPLDPAPLFLDPSLFFTAFGIAASQDELDIAMNVAIGRILDTAAGSPGGDAAVLCNFHQASGGAKGQVFMYAVTALVPPPQQPG